VAQVPLKVINVVSSASRALPLIPRFRTYCASHRLATNPVDAERGAADGGELRQAARALRRSPPISEA
jgi:hypothetical protein